MLINPLRTTYLKLRRVSLYPSLRAERSVLSIRPRCLRPGSITPTPNSTRNPTSRYVHRTLAYRIDPFPFEDYASVPIPNRWSNPMPDKLLEDCDLATKRNDSEAVRMVISSVSQLRDLYDKLGYPIHNEIEAWRLLDAIKQHLEIGPAAAGDLDELDNFMRGRWSHFSCEGYCMRSSFPELNDSERKELVEANHGTVTEDQWAWHRDDGNQSLGFKIDKLRANLGKDNETQLKCWDELSDAVHDAFIWLYGYTKNEAGSIEPHWKREQKLEEFEEFLSSLISHNRRRERLKHGIDDMGEALGIKENAAKTNLFELEARADKECEFWTDCAQEYMDRPWMHTRWLSNYLLVNILDAQIANNPLARELLRPTSLWFSGAVIAGIVISFILDWRWLAWSGIAYLSVAWLLRLISRSRFRRVEDGLALVRREVASLSYGGEELSRRLRKVEEKWPYLPSIAYSLVRLPSRPEQSA